MPGGLRLFVPEATYHVYSRVGRGEFVSTIRAKPMDLARRFDGSADSIAYQECRGTGMLEL